MNKHGSKWIRRDKRLAVYLRDGMRCVYCTKDLAGAEPEEMGLDHVVCRSKRLNHSETNLVTTCRSCNSRRGTQTVAQFAPEALPTVRRLTRRKLDRYRKQAKALLA